MRRVGPRARCVLVRPKTDSELIRFFYADNTLTTTTGTCAHYVDWNKPSLMAQPRSSTRTTAPLHQHNTRCVSIWLSRTLTDTCLRNMTMMQQIWSQPIHGASLCATARDTSALDRFAMGFGILFMFSDRFLAGFKLFSYCYCSRIRIPAIPV